MVSAPVSLFRCRTCKVRVFERDCTGHLARHGVNVTKLTPSQILTHFERGPKTAAARPGDGVKPTFMTAKTRRGRPVAETDDIDDIDLN